MYFFSFVKKFLVCFFILSPSYAFTVLVDPGHGGKDPGALSGSLQESGINLKVAFFLKDYLKKDPRFKVYLTRESDRYLSLENRVKISQRIKPDIFISLHANSFKDSSFKGAQFYFLNQLPPEKESMYLAFKKSHVLKKKKNQSIKKDDLYFILEDLKKNHQIRYSSYLAKSLSKSWKTPKAPHPFRINQAPFYLFR